MLIREVAKAIAKAICRKLTPAGRAIVVRDSIPVQDLTTHLPRELLMDLLFSISRRLKIPSIRIAGFYGEIEGSPYDDVILRTYAREGVWSIRFQTEIINRCFKSSSGCLVDVGANIGLTAIPAVKNHSITCFALEPDPTNFRFLERNIFANGLSDKITPINLAAYDRKVEIDFELSPDNLGDHRIRGINASEALTAPQQSEEYRDVIKISAMPLDLILEVRKLQHPIVVKIDTQGSEPAVLRGAKELLLNTDCLVVEFSPYTLARSGFNTDDFFECLEGFPWGYIMALDKDKDRKSQMIDMAPLEFAKISELCKTAERNVHPDNYFDIVLVRNKSFFSENN